MKERGLLMTGPNVIRILSGDKTQTRRLPGLEIPPDADEVFFWDEPTMRARGAKIAEAGIWARRNDEDGYLRFLGPCRQGMPGDRLWVRETWLELDRDHWGDRTLPREAIYSHPWPRVNACSYRADVDPKGDGEIARRAYGYRWRPSIFMPRWASWLLLEITEVRVQRLQDISRDDAIAEGLTRLPSEDGQTIWWGAAGGSFLSPRRAFEALWDSINGERAPWESNPWVVAITFKRVEARA